MATDERRREIAQSPRVRRHEEVAELAGIGTEWYAWLEQARDVRPSLDTLTRIAAALRLEPAPARHRFPLAEHSPAATRSVQRVSP